MDDHGAGASGRGRSRWPPRRPSLYAEERIRRREPSATERALADAVPELVPGGRHQLLYARVDLVPGADGVPLLLELECTEPSLFLDRDPSAANRLAAAIEVAAS